MQLNVTRTLMRARNATLTVSLRRGTTCALGNNYGQVLLVIYSHSLFTSRMRMYRWL
jgi:hypothetical protein